MYTSRVQTTQIFHNNLHIRSNLQGGIELLLDLELSSNRMLQFRVEDLYWMTDETSFLPVFFSSEVKKPL